MIESLAVYLVGAGCARAVQTNLRITEEFLDLAPDGEVLLRQAVEAFVGSSNTIPDEFRWTHRDPWIAEGVAHLILWLSRRSALLAVRGRVEALMTLHVQSKEPGIDLAALFTHEADLGMTIGEAKASELNATAHASHAAAFFREIDDGSAVREVQLRDRAQLLRQALKPSLVEQVTPALWGERRCYCAVVAFSSASTFQPTRSRRSYANLAPGADGVLLICFELDSYQTFFDAVADGMRALV